MSSSKISDAVLNTVLPITNTRTKSDWPNRVLFHEYLKDLRDNIVNKIEWRVIDSDDAEITNEDFSKLLWIKSDCILTVDSYGSLDDGFFCGIILSGEFRVEVKTTQPDKIRGDETFVLKDGVIVKSPIPELFTLIGKVE